MADNHSPYDPDPRQGRGGDRRTQALQAVSHFQSRNLHFISPGAPRLRWVQTPSPFCRGGRIGATSARRLHRRRHTFGGTIAKLRNQRGHKKPPLEMRTSTFWTFQHVNFSISGQRQRARGASAASNAQNVPRKQTSPEQKNNTRDLYIQHRPSTCVAYR